MAGVLKPVPSKVAVFTFIIRKNIYNFEFYQSGYLTVKKKNEIVARRKYQEGNLKT
jgi:hypothetical protein